MRICLWLPAICVAALPSTASTTHLLLPVPVGGRHIAPMPPADPDRFTFALCGDNRSAGRNVPAPPTAARVFAEMRLLQPAFILWTGDAIYGSDDTVGEARAEYDAFLAQASDAETPLYNAPGNHEIFDRPELAALYEAAMGRLYGSFDYGHSHFIALDTEEVGRKAGIGKEQHDWLQQDLKANRGAAHIFVFMHHPLFPKEEASGFADPANRDDIHHLFLEYGVKHVFSGHEHLYYKSVHDGITYWVSGGGGAPSDADPSDGGFQHYLQLVVDGPTVTVTLLQPWRLFVSVGAGESDGSCSARADNYNYADLPVSVEFPGEPQASIIPTASWTYKGKTHPLEAVVVPSRAPGVVTVRVVVPKNRSAIVRIHPRSSAKPATH